MKRKKIAVAFGTRPEAIKLAPLIRALAQRRDLLVTTFAFTQHREMLGQMLGALKVKPDFDFDLMSRGQTPNDVLARVVNCASASFKRARPDLVVVQGDTTTALAASLASFNAQIPVAHVEAGLRTYDFDNPFPEEANRRLIDHAAALCFAPTEGARENLLREKIERRRVILTGNTVVDAIRWAMPKVRRQQAALRKKIGFPSGHKRLILVTLHRRESFGRPLEEISVGLRRTLDAHSDCFVVYPVHPNPEVRSTARRFFKHARIRRCGPLGYFEFLGLLAEAYVVLSDSGGVQEEACVLHKPVIIARDATERPEIIAVGAGLLAGRKSAAITAALNRILDDVTLYRRMRSARNPFGDGRASQRIADAIARYLHERS